MRLLFDISRCTSGMHSLKRKINHSRCVLLDYRRSRAAGLHVCSGGTGNPSADIVTPHQHRGHHRSTGSVYLPYSSLGAPFRGCKRSQLWPEKPWTAGHTPVVFKSSSADATGKTTKTLTTPVESDSSPAPTALPLDDLKRILRLAHPERLRLSGRPLCCVS